MNDANPHSLQSSILPNLRQRLWCVLTPTALSQVLTDTGDVAMHRVKFNVNTEYGYINNMKVLQSKLRSKSQHRSSSS
jgi:hypothetical protein